MANERNTPPSREANSTTTRHLRRACRTALELELVGGAPAAMIEHLAASAGLLEAMSEVRGESAPVVALAETARERAHAALAEWHAWESENLPRGLDRLQRARANRGRSKRARALPVSRASRGR